VDFQALRRRAASIREQYAELERRKYGREWSSEELALGLVGDVGDLSKLISAKEGAREIEDLDAKLAHELVDCLWSVVVLAERYGVDLEQAFSATMDELEATIAAQL
jgi:NTP pyrophosphatase (non-canonical NTP hydrolase)